MSYKVQYQGEFLPPDLLSNLTRPTKALEDLGPTGNGNSKKGKAKAIHKVHSKRPPDNVWNHPKSRERFKHLTEQPPCTCGAGRDISFLYDSVGDRTLSKLSDGSNEIHVHSASPFGKISASPFGKILNENSNDTGTFYLTASRKSREGKESLKKEKDGSIIPESLIPSEFHIVKNPGVQGLEFHDEKFTTKTEDHEHHLTLFPSMKPSGRQEALQLKQALDNMLKKAGVDDDEGIDEEGVKDTKLPTQIHNLLELVKKEQNIYNIAFNEIIRQVSIECVERGEVLAELRKRYAILLDKVPRQVKSLHEEVLAQRALDRRLTEELTRFKSSVTLLTRELDEVQAHDREVTRQAQETQEELNEALRESEKNASLLSEYHELYELQRKRLEFQISKLLEERDLWAGASYILTLKVAARHNLTTAKRLHLHEKAWNKLASHFGILLKDLDCLELESLTNYVQQWQEVSEKFNKKLLHSEHESYRKFKLIKVQVEKWGYDFLRVVTPAENTVHAPHKDVALKLFEDLKSWEEVANYEVERFSGDALLLCEDDIVNLNKFVDGWIDVGARIFRRHVTENEASHPLYTQMIRINKDVEDLHQQFKLRMTGENGLAKLLIHFLNILDSVGSKLNAFAKGGEILLDTEWVRLADYLQNEWPELLTELADLMTPEDEKHTTHSSASQQSYENFQRNNFSDVVSLSQRAQKWLTDTNNAVENADGSLLDQVNTGHSGMIQWMITVLLRLAPDLEPSPILPDGIEEDSVNLGIGAAITAESTYSEIKQNAGLLFRRIIMLTNSLTTCSMDFVLEGMQKKKDEGDELAEMELDDLKKIKIECDGWIKTAILLIEELTGEVYAEDDLQELNIQGTPRTEIVSKDIAKSIPNDTMPKDEQGLTESALDNDNESDNKTKKDSKDTTDLTEFAKDNESDDRNRKDQRDTATPTSVMVVVGDAKVNAPTDKTDDTPSRESVNFEKEVTGERQGKTEQENNELVDKNEETTSNEQHANNSDLKKIEDNENKQDNKQYVDFDTAEMHVLGHDDNVKMKSLDELSVNQETTTKDLSGKHPDLNRALHALATVERLQKQLLDAEERAQAAEERAIKSETELKQAMERIRALERSLARETPEGSRKGSIQRPLSEMSSISETPVPLREGSEIRSPVPPSRESSKHKMKKAASPNQ